MGAAKSINIAAMRFQLSRFSNSINVQQNTANIIPGYNIISI